MVFESIVVDVLNRFLGNYVENLNRSQLKIGIWGGDVELENLVLKQNALEELNIPVQTVFGHLGKLVLKIPWKNLYGESVEATVERLFLVVNPIAEVRYDREKEEMLELMAKRAALARVEEAKKKEAQKDTKLNETFVEKLVTQIIKNVQLKITDIHIRYEDSITNPETPFSLGITLHNLSVHTTDENWKPTIIQEAVTKIFKILDLQGLALYWNPNADLYTKRQPENTKKSLHAEIATKSFQPPDYDYVLGPINATAKLKLNPKPEMDTPQFEIPKVILSLHMEQLSLKLNKLQYRDMMMLADSMDRMNKAAPYRKYRPDLKKYRGHYKEWWRFAYTCILETEVRRRRRNWEWEHMKAHRHLCKDYGCHYRIKLSSKGKVANDTLKVLENGEKILDLFNLVVIRQQMEMEVERLGKEEEESKKSRGWFSGWWSGSGTKEDDSAATDDLMKQFEKAMTADEKEKLFRAIDYQENSSPLHLPVEYVAVHANFKLDRLQMTVFNEKNLEVLKACVDDVEVSMTQRPSANAIRVDVQMKSLTATGVHQDDGQFIPQLILSKYVSEDVYLLNVCFETNPLDGSCDQRVQVSARPLQIAYDAQTVIDLANVFKPPKESSALATLQVKAGNKLSDLKEKSALGMQYAVQQRNFVDIDVDIAASYIVVAHTGKFKDMNEPCVVVKLGKISVRSKPRSRLLDISQMYLEGRDDEDIFREIVKHSYDVITLGLTEIQVVIAMKDEDWLSAIGSNTATHLHLLQPTNLVIQIKKCVITDDPRMPKIKILGELQKIAVSISEDRLGTLCEIVVSMPLPNNEETYVLKILAYKVAYVSTGESMSPSVLLSLQTDAQKGREFKKAQVNKYKERDGDAFVPSESKGSSLSLLKYLDPVEKTRRDTQRELYQKDEQSAQLTEVEAYFIMKELEFCINHKKFNEAKNCYDKFLVFSLNALELTVLQKTFILEAVVRLGGVSMHHHRDGNRVINMIDTMDIKTIEPSKHIRVNPSNLNVQYVFTIRYCNVDKKCPEFRSYYGSVEQLIELDFMSLRLLLHLEGLKEILFVINEIQNRVLVVQKSVDRVASAGPLETIMENEEFNAAAKSSHQVVERRKDKQKQVESIQIKVDAKIGVIEIEFATAMRPLSIIKLQGASGGLVVKPSYTQVDCAIGAIQVLDLNGNSLHKEIVKVLGGDVIVCQVVLYNVEQFPHVSDVNMSIDAQINCMRIVFLNWFVSSMLEFMANFQTAQQALIDASSQAADAARQNVTTAYQNAAKAALRVSFAAPIVVVPENSRSMKVLLIDLGHMTLKNTFVDLPIKNTTTQVTIEELTLDLEDMKMSCVKLTTDTEEGFINERPLLRPTTFKLLVKRNLSTWYEYLPDLDISGRIKTIVITVGHSDYKSIMKILNQNLQEGQTKRDNTKRPEAATVTSKSQVTSKPKVKTVASVDTPTPTEGKQAKSTMKFAFTMERFVIDLMSSAGEFSQDVPLARFCLAMLSLKGRMLSDGAMHTSVLLIDCTLDDMRPGRGTKITRYLERRRMSSAEATSETQLRTLEEEHIESKEKVRSMIDITYSMKDQDTFIDMRIFSFNLILAMDFMNKLADFMTTGLQADSVSKDGKPKGTVDKPSSSDMQKKRAVHATESQTASTAMMTVNIKIEKPDIILVESLEERNCDALVLNMEARFKLRQGASRMVADGGISGLQMFVRTLGAHKHDTPGRYLLAPAHLSLAVSRPPNQGMHVDIAVSDITVTFSPDTIALLNRVMATVTSSEEDAGVQENKTILYHNLWGMRPFSASSYWFLSTEEAEEVLEEDISELPEPQAPEGEICLLSSPSITVSFEMEVGQETIPLLVMEASLSGQVKDWSSELFMETTWAMQVSYYNIARAVWEPLVEPVEVMRDAQYKHEPWELKMEMVMRPDEPKQAVDTTDEAANNQAVALRLPNKTVTISSSEPLEITVTRTGLEVLTQLSNSFSGAVSTDASVSKSKLGEVAKKYGGAPYVLHNCTGLTVKLMTDNNKDFKVHLASGLSDDYKEVVVEPGASVPLQQMHGGFSMIRLNEEPPQLKLAVKIVEMSEDVVLPVQRADKRYFPIGRHHTSSNLDKTISHVAAIEPRGLISDIVMQDAAMHIYLRSIVQVTNNLSVSVLVYYMTLSGNEVRLLGDVAPGGILRLPLQAVHTPTAELFFSVEGFTVSVSPFVWRELQQEMKITKLLQCDSKDKRSGEKFYFKAIGTMEQVFFEHSNRHTFASSCYDIVLRPAVRLQNCLPVPIVVSQLGLKRTQTFEPGEMFQLSHLSPNRASIVIKIPNYLDKCWACTKNLPDELMELSVWSFESHDSPTVSTLELGMHSADQDGTQGLSLYCPFWMLNKTGFTLGYRNADDASNVIFHPKDYHQPVLFSFRAKNFFGKKKAAIRIEFGEWSDKFSLDVPGSSGVITCSNSGRIFQVAVTNQLTFNSLTKMVIFTPYYLIINDAPFPIQYQELTRSADPWETVDENTSAPLWPMVDREDKLLVLRVACTLEMCAPFLYTEQHTACLKLQNDYGGLYVEVQTSEGGTYITIRQYHDGNAPALLINYTPHTVSLYEKENVNTKQLPSMHQMLFSWDNPAGPQVLIFEAHKRKEHENDLRKDDIGSYMLNETTRIHWVSFLDGLQRVILFTLDPILASGAHTIGEAEHLDMEIVISMQGMGLSLVNDLEMQEIAYISISNSGIIWEQCKIGARRYKKIEGHKYAQLEDAYQRYLAEIYVTGATPATHVVQMGDKMEVDFAQMRILRPSPRLLRRTLEAGLWASLGSSPHSWRIHARLHRLQVDQQLPLPTFPVVLAPVPPPRSIANENLGMKPFIEVSIVERTMEQSNVRQYKYYKVLIQEFHVKADMGLINALMGMFPSRALTDKEALTAFQLDLERANQGLEAMAAIAQTSDQKNFYDNLHLSPLKVHVSFSLGGSTSLPSFIGTVLQSIGVTLTDMNDVVFKLSYYERNYEFLSQKELMSQVQNHYTGQAIKQLYVLVLGLDVIGNPYGLVIGLKKGVEDLFYEPFQGAIQGPGEFAEGLFLGVRSLVGHTVGGAAGAVSRITGAMGHGLAALSLDKDFQRRRRDNINKPPANLQEGIARSGKGLVMGVYDGVTGVFTQPIEGAREGGVEGFFKGMGKGAVGLFTRPTSGIVDFASGSFDAVKSVVDGVTGVVVRPLQGAHQSGAPGFVKGLGRGAIGLVVRPVGGVVDFTYGLLNTVKRAADLSEDVTKRRAARYLPPETGVRPYSRLQAEGYKMLFELEKGKFVSTDTYEAHVWVVPGKEAAMCTDKRLIYLEKNSVFGGWQITWSFLWSEIPEPPKSVPNGVYIPTAKKKVLGMFPSSGTGKVIFLYDEQHRKYFLSQCNRLMSSR